jgi:hypothetical protein
MRTDVLAKVGVDVVEVEGSAPEESSIMAVHGGLSSPQNRAEAEE